MNDVSLSEIIFFMRPAGPKPAFLNVFMIVGAQDTPLLFLDLTSEGVRDDSPHLDEFIVHAGLDSVDALLVCLKIKLYIITSYIALYTG